MPSKLLHVALVQRGELRHRLRAARELAGYKSSKDLADRINEHGLGRGTLSSMESGKFTDPSRQKLREIAAVCGLDVRYFDDRLDPRKALTAAAGDIPDPWQEARSDAEDIFSVADEMTPTDGAAGDVRDHLPEQPTSPTLGDHRGRKPVGEDP